MAAIHNDEFKRDPVLSWPGACLPMPTLKKPGRPKGAGGRVASKRKLSMGDGLPGRRAMEGLLSLFSSGLGAGLDRDPLDEAQGLMYRAWELTARRQRVALAKEALRISPLCADAYVLLAEETATTLDEVIELYRKVMEAGEGAVGPKAFKDDVGYFWGLLETRRHMRARNGLVEALWVAGQNDEAISHYRELLRLNPNDNQGNRYLLAGYLLALDRNEELTELLDAYGQESSAEWSYTRALLAFRQHGDTTETRSMLAEAATMNSHAVRYLLGQKKLAWTPASYITMVGEDEAQEYARCYAATWANTAGAMEWLAAHLLPNAKKPRSR